MTNGSLMKVESIAECSPWSNGGNVLIMLVNLFLWSHENCGCNSRGLMLSILVPTGFIQFVSDSPEFTHR